MVSHRNVIANTMQVSLHDAQSRKELGFENQVSMGLLPFSHIYALVVVTHAGVVRGDEIIVLPRFDFKMFCSAIQKFKISLVPVVSDPVSRAASTPQNQHSHGITRSPRSLSQSSETKPSHASTTSRPSATSLPVPRP